MPEPQPYVVPDQLGKSSPGVVSRSSPSKTVLSRSKALYVVLRSADPLLQYLIYTQGWGNALLRLVGLSASTPVIGLLSPRQKLLVGFAAVGAARQIFWSLYVTDHDITMAESLRMSVFNMISDTCNTLFSLSVPSWYLSTSQYIGSCLFCLGSVIESASEWHRQQFKRRPENEDKLLATGLWRTARHINYGGHILWRSGYAISTGNLYALWNPFLHTWDFAARGIPMLETHMSRKYKGQWENYTSSTRYKLFPYLW
ncbi:hypothetical protein DFS34DRAFT_625672 [Phlyctochytrium arcticum]|nr:hypothetical protein DFS34DRAFT_625672 [Phlyctochytrium arcticum]